MLALCNYNNINFTTMDVQIFVWTHVWLNELLKTRCAHLKRVFALNSMK